MKKIFVFAFLITLISCKTPVEKIEPVAPGFEVSAGKLERLANFPSEFVPARHVDVWLPPGYPSDGNYNVLYMHDGQMLFDAGSTWNGQEWGVDETISELLKQGEIHKTIVVGIWNSGSNRHAEYFPQKPFEQLPAAMRAEYEQERTKREELFTYTIFSDAYLQFLVKEVKPYVDRHYATNPSRDATFIAGSSMGGLISWYAVTEYPQIFKGAAALSTHWPGNFSTENNVVPSQFLAYLDRKLPAPGSHRFYFDYGTRTLDSIYEPYQIKVDSLMRAKGYNDRNWKTLKFKGADHSEKSWQERFEIPLKFLLKK